MKNAKKILVVLCIAAFIVATVAVSVSAAVSTDPIRTAGTDLSLADYMSVYNNMLCGYDDGIDTVTSTTEAKISAGFTVIKDDGKGAPYIYAEDGETASKGYLLVDHRKNDGSFTNPFSAPRVGVLSDALNNENTNPKKGYVSEFDICTPSGADYDGTTVSFNLVIMQTGSKSDGCFENHVKFEGANGKIKVTGLQGPSGTLEAETAGGWIHITVVYTPDLSTTSNDDDGTITVYANQAAADRDGLVERVCIAQWSNYISSKNAYVYPLMYRFGATSATTGSFGLDNFLWYQSTEACDPDYITHLDGDDALIAYVETMLDTGVSAIIRNNCYNKIKDELISTYYDGTNYTANAPVGSAVRTAAENYVEFVSDPDKVDELVNSMGTASVMEFKEKVDALKAMGRGFSNIKDRKSVYQGVVSFHTENLATMNVGHADYISAKSDLDTWGAYVTDDEKVAVFCEHMISFNNSKNFGDTGNAGSMRESYEAAKEYYDFLGNAVDNNCVDFKNTTEANTLKAAIAAYQTAENAIAIATKKSNSKTFVGYMAIFADTNETDWANDTDGVYEKQWYFIRNYLENHECTSSYPSYNTNKAKYDSVHSYFWEKKQNEHISIITEKLSVFENPKSTYVDKASASTFITNYLLLNDKDIDPANTEINNLRQRNEEYKLGLPEIEIEYSELLRNNTKAFKDKMNEIAGFTAYADVKPRFDEATKLYFSMNTTGNSQVTNEDVANAIKAYEELKVKLMNVEATNTTFVNTMSGINNITDKNEKYKALLVCYKCEETLDNTYAGVSTYRTQYNTLRDQYIANSTTANSEFTEAIDTVGSTRAFLGIDKLVKFICDLFN